MNNISSEAARVAAASSAALHTQSKIHYRVVPSSLEVASPQVLQGHRQSKEYRGKRQMCHLLKGRLGAKPKMQPFNFLCWEESCATVLHVVSQIPGCQKENNVLILAAWGFLTVAYYL